MIDCGHMRVYPGTWLTLGSAMRHTARFAALTAVLFGTVSPASGISDITVHPKQPQRLATESERPIACNVANAALDATTSNPTGESTTAPAVLFDFIAPSEEKETFKDNPPSNLWSRVDCHDTTGGGLEWDHTGGLGTGAAKQKESLVDDSQRTVSKSPTSDPDHKASDSSGQACGLTDTQRMVPVISWQNVLQFTPSTSGGTEFQIGSTSISFPSCINVFLKSQQRSASLETPIFMFIERTLMGESVLVQKDHLEAYYAIIFKFLLRPRSLSNIKSLQEFTKEQLCVIPNKLVVDIMRFICPSLPSTSIYASKKITKLFFDDNGNFMEQHFYRFLAIFRHPSISGRRHADTTTKSRRRSKMKLQDPAANGHTASVSRFPAQTIANMVTLASQMLQSHPRAAHQDALVFQTPSKLSSSAAGHANQFIESDTDESSDEESHETLSECDSVMRSCSQLLHFTSNRNAYKYHVDKPRYLSCLSRINHDSDVRHLSTSESMLLSTPKKMTDAFCLSDAFDTGSLSRKIDSNDDRPSDSRHQPDQPEAYDTQLRNGHRRSGAASHYASMIVKSSFVPMTKQRFGPSSFRGQRKSAKSTLLKENVFLEIGHENGEYMSLARDSPSLLKLKSKFKSLSTSTHSPLSMAQSSFSTWFMPGALPHDSDESPQSVGPTKETLWTQTMDNVMCPEDEPGARKTHANFNIANEFTSLYENPLIGKSASQLSSQHAHAPREPFEAHSKDSPGAVKNPSAVFKTVSNGVERCVAETQPLDSVAPPIQSQPLLWTVSHPRKRLFFKVPVRNIALMKLLDSARVMFSQISAFPIFANKGSLLQHRVNENTALEYSKKLNQVSKALKRWPMHRICLKLNSTRDGTLSIKESDIKSTNPWDHAHVRALYANLIMLVLYVDGIEARDNPTLPNKDRSAVWRASARVAQWSILYALFAKNLALAPIIHDYIMPNNQLRDERLTDFRLLDAYIDNFLRRQPFVTQNIAIDTELDTLMLFNKLWLSDGSLNNAELSALTTSWSKSSSFVIKRADFYGQKLSVSDMKNVVIVRYRNKNQPGIDIPGPFSNLSSAGDSNPAPPTRVFDTANETARSALHNQQPHDKLPFLSTLVSSHIPLEHNTECSTEALLAAKESCKSDPQPQEGLHPVIQSAIDMPEAALLSTNSVKQRVIDSDANFAERTHDATNGTNHTHDAEQRKSQAVYQAHTPFNAAPVYTDAEMTRAGVRICHSCLQAGLMLPSQRFCDKCKAQDADAPAGCLIKRKLVTAAWEISIKMDMDDAEVSKRPVEPQGPERAAKYCRRHKWRDARLTAADIYQQAPMRFEDLTNCSCWHPKSCKCDACMGIDVEPFNGVPFPSVVSPKLERLKSLFTRFYDCDASANGQLLRSVARLYKAFKKSKDISHIRKIIQDCPILERVADTLGVFEIFNDMPPVAFIESDRIRARRLSNYGTLLGLTGTAIVEKSKEALISPFDERSKLTLLPGGALVASNVDLYAGQSYLALDGMALRRHLVRSGAARRAPLVTAARRPFAITQTRVVFDARGDFFVCADSKTFYKHTLSRTDAKNEPELIQIPRDRDWTAERPISAADVPSLFKILKNAYDERNPSCIIMPVTFGSSLVSDDPPLLIEAFRGIDIRRMKTLIIPVPLGSERSAACVQTVNAMGYTVGEQETQRWILVHVDVRSRTISALDPSCGTRACRIASKPVLQAVLVWMRREWALCELADDVANERAQFTQRGGPQPWAFYANALRDSVISNTPLSDHIRKAAERMQAEDTNGLVLDAHERAANAPLERALDAKVAAEFATDPVAKRALIVQIHAARIALARAEDDIRRAEQSPLRHFVGTGMAQAFADMHANDDEIAARAQRRLANRLVTHPIADSVQAAGEWLLILDGRFDACCCVPPCPDTGTNDECDLPCASLDTSSPCEQVSDNYPRGDGTSDGSQGGPCVCGSIGQRDTSQCQSIAALSLMFAAELLASGRSLPKRLSCKVLEMCRLRAVSALQSGTLLALPVY